MGGRGAWDRPIHDPPHTRTLRGLEVIDGIRRLSVLIPVYNERATIDHILDAVHAVPIAKEVVCVDDASTDGTGERLAVLHA